MKNFKLFLKATFSIKKSYLFLVVFKALFDAMITLFSVYSLKILFNAITNQTLDYALGTGLFIIIVNFILRIFSKFLDTRTTYMGHYIGKMFYYKITDKVFSLPYKYLEDPEFLDLKSRAVFNFQNQGSIYGLIESIAIIVQNIFTVISLFIVMATFGYELIVAVLVVGVVSVLLLLISAKALIKFYGKLVPINRRFGYYIELINQPKSSKDFRIFDASDLVLNRFDSYQKETMSYMRGLFWKQGVINSIDNLMTASLTAFTLFYVGKRTLEKSLGIGNFSMYVSAVLNCSKAIALIVNSIMDFYRYSSLLEPWVELINIKEDINDGNEEINYEIETIEFKNVSFTYPRMDKKVLENISFKINKGEHISIVGLNGAGKTTLIKLLCRLYEPSSGEILINGNNINKYNASSYNKLISCVFQDFKIFDFSIYENVRTNENITKEEALKLLDSVGLTDKINTLEHKIDTNLGKELFDDGINLSGGESQKIAIARALAKQSQIIVLDEPTSALDPMSEAEIYEKFHDLVLNKTALYISHRMSSSVFCDKILVISDGKIIAYDTHTNLMKDHDSLYYKMFNAQAINYMA